MHCSVSGCGDVLVQTEDEAIACARALPLLSARRTATAEPPRAARAAARRRRAARSSEIVPRDENKPFDMMARDRARSSTRARCSRSRRSSRGSSSPASRASTAGRSGSSRTSRRRRAACCSSTRPTRPRASSGCATRSTCRSLFLADVPGFMIGTQGRAAGHHPRGREDDQRGHRGDRAARSASSCARPTARGSTRCAARPSSPSATLALPQAMIAVMGPEAAVNAVYFNKIQELPEAERAAYVAAAARRVPRGHRPREARERARRRRGGPGRRAARRARAPLRALRRGLRAAAERKRGVLPV